MVSEDYYVPENNKVFKHDTEGANAMLIAIRTELGPAFFSADMQLSTEEKAKQDAEKFKQLR